MMILNLSVFATVLALLGYVYQKTQKLGQTVLLALLLGLGFGALLQAFG